VHPVSSPASPDEVIRLARKLWGEPTDTLRRGEELRFGRHGSKSVRPRAGVWHDHEAQKGGGVKELYIEAGELYPGSATIVATYDYCAENGSLLYQVVRKYPHKFIQRRPDASERDGWTWNLHGVRRVPYRLPQLLASDGGQTVWIPEGEKDVDALVALGLVATCNSGGAGKWQPEFARYLEGRRVVVLPDNDDVGREHAGEIARSLLGVAASLVVLALPGLDEKGDISDWLAAGGTEAELRRLARECEPWAEPAINGHTHELNGHAHEPQPEPPAEPEGYWDGLLANAMQEADFAPHGAEPASQASHAPELWDWDEEDWIEADLPIRPWLAHGYVMREAVTLIGGSPGAGKSQAGVAWAIALATGREWGRFRPNGAYRVMLLNCEDKRDEQRKRFSATLRQFDLLSRDVAKRVIRVSPHGSGAILAWDTQQNTIRITDQGRQFLAKLETWGGDALFLDPFVELHGAPENDNMALRVVLAFFRALAERLKIAVVLVHHTRKGDQTPGDPEIFRGAGSIVGAIRAGFTVCHMSEKDASDLGISPKGRKHYFRIDSAKQNYAPSGEAEWVERIAYELDNHEITAAAVPWTPPESKPQSVDDVTAMATRIGIGVEGLPWSPNMRQRGTRSVSFLFEEFGILKKDWNATLDSMKREFGITEGTFKGPDRHWQEGLKTADGKPVADWK
jgi:hypothetical protein